MFSFFKNKKKNADSTLAEKSSLVLKIDGMHCNSCSMNIDGELEDLNGVFEANTSYAKQEARVSFDKSKTSEVEIKKIIEGLGYKVG